MAQRSLRTNLVLLCLLGLAVILVGTANAATIAVTPEGDGYYHKDLYSTYFKSDSLQNKVQYTFYGTSDSTQQNTAYTQFSLSSVATESTIASATLNIYMENTYIGTSTYAGFIKHVANASSATGLASQKLGGSELVANVGDIGEGWKSFDITDFLQSDLDNGYAYSCFSFNYDASGNYSDRNSGFSFASGETANAPYLSVAIPEPMTLSLLLTGAVAVIRKRRK